MIGSQKIYEGIQNGDYNLPTNQPENTIRTLNKVKEIAIQEIQNAFRGEVGGESKYQSREEQAKNMHDKAAKVLEEVDKYIKQLRESPEAKGMTCLEASKKCTTEDQPQPVSKTTEDADGAKPFSCPGCKSEIIIPKAVNKDKPLFRCGHCDKIWETRFDSFKNPMGILTHGEEEAQYYPIFKNSTPATPPATPAPVSTQSVLPETNALDDTASAAPVLPETNPLDRDRDMDTKDDDPPTRIPKLRKPIKKHNKTCNFNANTQGDGKSLETLRCTVDDNGELRCDDPAKVSKFTYHNKLVNRINYGDSKDNDTNKSSVATEIPDNPFKKASDENWLENNVLNHTDYSKTKKKLDNYLAFLNDSNYFDHLNDISKWIDTLPNNIEKFPNSLKEKLVIKKKSKQYFTILKKCLNQLSLDMPRSLPSAMNQPNIDSTEFENLIKQSATKLGLNDKITVNHPKVTKIGKMTYHCSFIVLCIIFLEESINAFRYVQGQDRLLVHIFFFTKKIVSENPTKADEFIYIYYFLLKNIIFGKYPIAKPIAENIVEENENTGISFFNILFFQPNHFTYENTVSGTQRPWLKYEENAYYDKTKESLIFSIFISIILKKHRDIFSNMLILSGNVSKFIFHFLKEGIGLYIGDTGIQTVDSTKNYKKSNIVNPGIMGNTDLNIVKNIYGNFLKTHNLLALLTSFFISYTSQLGQKLTFNNLPFVNEMEFALKHPKIHIGKIFIEGKKNTKTKPSPNSLFEQKNLYKNQLALTHFGFRLWMLFTGGNTFWANYDQEKWLGGKNNFFYKLDKLKQDWKNISIPNKDNKSNITEDKLKWDGIGDRPAGDRNKGDIVQFINEEAEKKGWVWTIQGIKKTGGIVTYNLSGFDPKPGLSLIGRQNPEHWSYTEDAINDYNVIINFLNSNKLDELLNFFNGEMPHWYSIPKLPVDFILYDNSMWNIPYEETWQKSNAIFIDGIPQKNPLSNILCCGSKCNKDDDFGDDNDDGRIKMLDDSCPRMGGWVTKLRDPQKIQKTIDALEKCIEKYKKYDSTTAKEKVRASETQLRYLKKKLVLMQIEEGKNPFELSDADQQRIDNMTSKEQDVSNKEIELLFGPQPITTCSETKECREASSKIKELETKSDEPDDSEGEFKNLEAEVEAEAEAEAEAEEEEIQLESLPRVLKEQIRDLQELISRQKNNIWLSNKTSNKWKGTAKRTPILTNPQRKTRKRHNNMAKLYKNKEIQLKKILANNEKVLRSLKRTARQIIKAQQENATTSTQNPVHEGGGKLSRGQLADYRLKHIQKLLNKQKKNKTLKKFNRRLNKTIKLY